MTLYNGDCLEIMPILQSQSIDMILCDLPYGTTACSWDAVIPFDKLWENYYRLIKPKGAIVLTASQPFTSTLVMSNPGMFKHEWIWEKAVGSNFATLKYQPMKEHESVLVFCNGSPNYYPIMQDRKGGEIGKSPDYTGRLDLQPDNNGEVFNKISRNRKEKIYGEKRNPSSVQFFNNRLPSDRGSHPTQKPLALMEYIIKTYTKEGETVMDNCMGSGTTGAACKNLNRKFIGIEKDEKYFQIAEQRITPPNNRNREGA